MNKKEKVELAQIDLKLIYNEGCTSVTTDINSFYADYIKTNVILKYKEYTYYTLIKHKKPKYIKIKRFKNYKSEI